MSALSLLFLCVSFVASKQFFHLADLRIEPYYDATNPVDRLCRKAVCVTNPNDPSCQMYKVGPTPYDALGRPGCDGPIGLLDSMLAHMKSVNSAPQFILTSGDLIAHGLDLAQGHLVQTEVLKRIRNAFPSTPIIPCVGNHDMFPKNTLSETEFARLRDLFAPNTALPADTESMSKFNKGGYFTWVDTANKLKVIMLNTGLVSPKSAPDSLLPKWKAVAEEQFLWIKEELAKSKAAGEKVILSGHIPPGRYTTDGDGWFVEEAERFQTLVESYSDVVMIQLFSHFSTELIRSFSPSFGQLVAQGLSPRFSQVASYQHLETSGNVVVNASTFGLDLAAAASGKSKWRLLYSLPTMYQVADVSAASIASTVSKIVNVTDFGGEYVRFQFPLESDVIAAPRNITTQLLCETMSLTAASTAQCMAEIASKKCPSSGCPSVPPSPCPACPSSPPTGCPPPATCPTCPVPAPSPACPTCPACPVPAPSPACPQCPPQSPCPTPGAPAPTAEPCKTCPPVMPCPAPTAEPKYPECGTNETVCTPTLQKSTGCVLGRCVSLYSLCSAPPTPGNSAAAKVADTADVGTSGGMIAALVLTGAMAMGGAASALYFRSQLELMKKQMDYMPVRATMYNPINEGT